MFDDIFQKDVSSGRISPGDGRHVILDADAVGDMRRELVDNLGWEVARGILERAGFRSGRSDARKLKSRYRWPSEEEGLRAGQRLHYLEGMAKVNPDAIEIVRADGLPRVKGDWLESYEAEQHLKRYGTGNRSVCWMLEGYTTGYATELFGQEILCLETRCRAKGDPVCGFELRPEKEWGNAGLSVRRLLGTTRFNEHPERCLHNIADMVCQLQKSSMDAIFTFDAQGVVISCSPAAEALLGLLPGEALGKKVGSYFAGGAAEAARIVARLEADGRISSYLTEIVTPGGRKTPVALAASAMRNIDGEIAGFLGVARNLSEVRKLEDELASKNRFMANILQDSADAIITLDPDDYITSWNRGAEAIFGYTATEAVGRHFNIIVPPELRNARELAQLKEKLRTQGAIRSHQTERLTKDGRRIQVLFTRTAIRDNFGKLTGSSAVLKDVTIFRNLERQLADAERLATLGELSAGLAHEIKNPLAGIKGAIDVIHDSMPQTDVHREILGDVLHEVNRIDKIVRDLLNYAKPKPPSHTAIDLPDSAQRIIAMFRQSAKNETLSIRLECPVGLPGFTGDETQLEQVLLNLLLNSQNAMPSGGHILVRLFYDSEEAIIRMEVEDDGIGMPEEIRKKIFHPFFTTRTDGTGMGLATCLKNVQYHGGTIDVQSEPGRGTKFTVNIPLLCRI